MTDTLAGPNDLFRVLVLSAPEDPADFTPILMEQLGLNKIDARIQQHNFPGLIQQPVTKEVAEQICQQIKGPVFYRPDIGTAELIEKRLEMVGV